jgi:hypothetical protein
VFASEGPRFAKRLEGQSFLAYTIGAAGLGLRNIQEKIIEQAQQALLSSGNRLQN